MYGLTLAELIGIVAGSLTTIALIAEGIIFLYDFFKSKPDIKHDLCYLNEYEKNILYFRFQISNITPHSFKIKRVFLIKHFLLFFYRNKIEVSFKEDSDFHNHKNPFTIEDIIKPNMRVAIVVYTDMRNGFDSTKYSSLDYTDSKIKFIFKTTKGSYKYTLDKNWQKRDDYLQTIKNMKEELRRKKNEAIEN